MSRKPAKKPAPPPVEVFPRVVETFRDPDYETRLLGGFDEPSCFNGIVRVRRYRVTVEVIDEPVEVIRERLLKLWRESDNHHHSGPLKAVAAKYGLDLDYADFGCARRRSP